ncbi:MAG: hypothetical protein WA949_19025 [Phormidesmis sp.]
MILMMTFRQTALLGIFTLVGGSMLIVAATYLGIYYDVLGKMFPNSKKFPDSKVSGTDKE